MRTPGRGLALRAALTSTLVLTLAACVTIGPATEPEPTTPPPVAATWPAPPTPSATPAPATPTGPPTVTIGLVGDLMFARDVVTLMEQHGPGYVFERVTPLFEGVDLLVGNLEGAFSDRGERLNKHYTFRAPPRLAVALRDAGFDAVSLANNHALDYGPVSLADTRDTLDAIGVGYFGAGAGSDEAMRPLVLEASGMRVALLGFSAVNSSVFATSSRPGVGGGVRERAPPPTPGRCSWWGTTPTCSSRGSGAATRSSSTGSATSCSTSTAKTSRRSARGRSRRSSRWSS